MDANRPGPLWHRLLWLAAIWMASLAVVLIVALVIRYWLAP